MVASGAIRKIDLPFDFVFSGPSQNPSTPLGARLKMSRIDMTQRTHARKAHAHSRAVTK